MNDKSKTHERKNVETFYLRQPRGKAVFLKIILNHSGMLFQ